MNNIMKLKGTHSSVQRFFSGTACMAWDYLFRIHRRHCRRFNLLLIIILFSSFYVSAQEEDNISPVLDPAAVVDTIVGSYNDWETVELNGKLRMDKLPLSPSVRIFMRKGEEISISVRASFIGEVGRIRIWGDSIFAVNKMKRVYALESLDRIKSFYPTVISEVQSLLLGRVVVFGYGELAQTNKHLLDIYDLLPQMDNNEVDINHTDSLWSMENSIEVGNIGDIDYRYDLFRDGRINEFLVGLYDHDISLGMDFGYSGNKTAMHIKLQDGEKVKFDAIMEFDKPNWDPSPMAPLKLNSKYRQVAISQFVKSF